MINNNSNFQVKTLSNSVTVDNKCSEKLKKTFKSNFGITPSIEEYYFKIVHIKFINKNNEPAIDIYY